MVIISQEMLCIFPNISTDSLGKNIKSFSEVITMPDVETSLYSDKYSDRLVGWFGGWLIG